MKRVLAFASLSMISLACVAGAQTLSLSPASVNLSATVGGTTPVSATINVTASSGTIAYVAFNSNSSSSPWLSLGATSGSTPSQTPVTGSTPGSFVIFANPSGLAANSYTGSITVSGNGASTSINVTFVVSTIGISPQPPVLLSYQVNSGSFPSATLQLTGQNTTYTAAVPTSSNCSWLVVTPTTGTSPGTLAVLLNPSVVLTLAPNTYSCTFTITPANSPGTQLQVPVDLTVSAAPTVTVNPSSISMNYQTATAVFPSQTLTLTSNGTVAVPYSLFAQSTDTGYTGTLWFTLSKTSGTLTPPGNTDQVIVAYNQGVSLPAGTYHGEVTVTAENASQTIPIQLLVSNTPLLNVAPSTVTFTSELNGSAPAPVTVEATATSGQPAITVVPTTTSGGNWLFAQVGATTSSGTPITISVNVSGLTLGQYKGTVSVYGSTTGSTPQTVGVTLNVANDPLISTNVSTSEPLVFAYQTGGTAPATETITVSSTTGATLSYTAVAANTATTNGCGSNWLQLAGSTTGATSGSFTVTASPTGITAVTSGAACTGTITIAATNPATGNAAPNSPYVIPVSFYVSASALLVVTPASAPAFSAQVGVQGSVVSQNCITNTSSNCALTITSTSATDPLSISVNTATTDGATWLFAVPTSATIPLNGSTALTIGLAFIPSTPGSYSGTVTITAVAASSAKVLDSPLIIPVTLQVTAGAPTATPAQLSFTQTLGGSAPAAQTISVGSSTGQSLSFTASATTTTPPSSSWLTVTPTSGTTPGTLTVSVSGASLAASTTAYTGQITITASGAVPVTVPVSFTVNAGTISASPATLAFSQVQGGTAPAAQAINVNGTPGAISFTTSATTANGGNWLTVTPASGATPALVTVSASAGTLTASGSPYTGTVTITAPGATGSPIAIPVTLTVTAPQTLSVTPATLNFSAIAGQPSPSAQIASLTSSGSGTPFTASVLTQSGGTWLTVSPTSGVTPAQLTISVASQALAAGNYQGTISINSPNTAAPITLTVNVAVASIPTPVIAAVQNAASYALGGVSPGENIYIKGTGIGPATLTVAAPSATGPYPTALGNTQVFFGSVAAPVLYVSATATSVMVPYEIAGQPTTNVTVVYQGVTSAPLTYNVVSTAPGIYTLNESGTGPGAILNQNYSVNGPNNPAAIGSVVAVYMTGEGVTSPASTTGGVAPGNGTGLNHPIPTVTATVGGMQATVNYAGSAPDIIYGVMQVNLTIPAGVSAGAQPIVISVGSNFPTQTGVTINVQAAGTAEPQ
ncbi:MAG: BACON domain-containing protein [Bryobacteraceae bacterium]